MRRNGGERPGGGFDGNTYSRLKFSNKFVSFKLKLIKPSYGPPLHRRPLRQQQSVLCLSQSRRTLVDPEPPPTVSGPTGGVKEKESVDADSFS